MKKINLLLIVFVLALTGAKAERINIPGLDLPQLIISEVRPASEQEAYVELTNVGTTTLDLSEFQIFSGWGNTRITTYNSTELTWNGLTNDAIQGHLGRVPLKGELAAGESFVVSTAWDQNDANGRNIPIQNTAVAALSDQLVHKSEATNQRGWIDRPDWQCYPYDSISPIVYEETSRFPQLFGNGTAYGLSSTFYVLAWTYATDSAAFDSVTYIDNFNFYLNLESSTSKGVNIRTSIAGMNEEHVNYVMLRKPSVQTGNMDWSQSRGVDAATSEWIVLPEPSSKQFAFTTVGHFGDATLKVEAKDPTFIQVDEATKTLSVPAEIYRYDSLSFYFDLAPNMTWSYTLNNSFEDSAKYTVCTGDSITFYAVGNELQSESYRINVLPSKTSLAQVFPTKRLIENFNEAGDSVISRTWSNGAVFGVTNNLPVDSITGVGFATRIDTLYKYLLVPEGAEMEIIYHDNEERLDLQLGDVLRVTSSDKSNYKDYAIAVNDYSPSSDAKLRVVTWPDVNTFMNPDWTQGDTLVEFSSNKLVYKILLSPMAKEVPALQFKPNNVKSTITVERAENLKGSIAERTTTVNVLAQDDSTLITYTFTFERLSIDGVQPYKAEPFFSEFIWQNGQQAWALEIFNPGSVDLDLSQYVILKNESGTLTWQEIIETQPQAWNSTGGLRMYENFYVPSMRWKNDDSQESWDKTPTDENPTLGAGFLISDNETDAIVSPKDVWVASVGTKDGQKPTVAPADFVFTGWAGGSGVPLWDQYAWSDSTALYLQANPCWNDAHGNYYLVKILSDSIRNGLMNVNTDVYNNYELIDMVVFKGDSVAGKWTNEKVDNKQKYWFCRRKPSSYYPIKEARGGAFETAESSDWIAYSSKHADWADLPAGTTVTQDLGQHITDPITGYISTVTSSKFDVDLGYEGDLKIEGDVAAYTPTTILEVINKATPGQVLEFKRGDVVVGAGEALAGNDSLIVTSEDGLNQTSYTLVNAPLNDDVSLTPVAGSGLTVSGTVVSGVEKNLTVKELVAKLQVNAKAVLEIEDASGALIPKTVHNLDTLVFDQVVSDNVKLAVRAENGDKKVYSLDFGFTASDVYLFSTIYPIDQEKELLEVFPEGLTPKSIKDYVFANEGSTYRILDRNGYLREIGNLVSDDVIEVTSKDGSVKVIYTFVYEKVSGIEEAQAPANQIILSPNPAKNRLNISGVDVKSVEVFALSGKQLLRDDVFTGSLDVSGLGDGIYILTVEDKQGFATTLKFVKE